MLLVAAQRKGRKCFYLTTHSKHFIYGYMASDLWLRTILSVSDSEKGNPMSPHRLLFPISSKVFYAPSHIQDSTYHGLCYTSRGALAGTRNTSVKHHNQTSHKPPQICKRCEDLRQSIIVQHVFYFVLFSPSHRLV